MADTRNTPKFRVLEPRCEGPLKGVKMKGSRGDFYVFIISSFAAVAGVDSPPLSLSLSIQTSSFVVAVLGRLLSILPRA